MILRAETSVTSHIVKSSDSDVLAIQEQDVKDVLTGRAMRLGFTIEEEPTVNIREVAVPIEGNPEESFIIYHIEGELKVTERTVALTPPPGVRALTLSPGMMP